MSPALQHSSFRAAKLLLGALIFLQACSYALSSNGETCYSRQHRDTTVNVRKALDHQKTVMEVRKKEAERDCILACCSEELKPGIKCNMVMYKPLSQDGIENCYLFHCETEQDCPLMSAKPGTNTYDIFKGLTHPATKGKEKVPTIPITITKQPSTTQSTTTTTKPTTTTTTTQPTTTTTTTQSAPTMAPTTEPASTIAPTYLTVIFLTVPDESTPATTATTTTTTTQSTTTTTKVPTTTSTTTTTHPVQPPQPPPNPVRPSKKQIKPPKKPDQHGKPNAKVPDNPSSHKPAVQKTMAPAIANTTTTTTTTTSTPTTTTTTTTPSTTTTTTTPSTTTTTTTPSTTTTTTPTTTTTTTKPTTTTTTTPTTTTTTTTTTSTTTTERTTIVVVEMENDLKNSDSGAEPPATDKTKESHLMLKNSLALLVVLTLIILTFVVAIVGRRAMESFDRRHYTRLELNDLHYEI